MFDLVFLIQMLLWPTVSYRLSQHKPVGCYRSYKQACIANLVGGLGDDDSEVPLLKSYNAACIENEIGFTHGLTK